MGQKDASDKNNENMLFKIASNVATGFHAQGPAIVKMVLDEGTKQMPEETEEGWNAWCNKMVSEKWIDSDTAVMLKALSRWSKAERAVIKPLLKISLFFGRYQKMLAISSLDAQYSFMQLATPHPAPVDNLVRSMIIDPARSTENRGELKKHGFNDLQIDNIILSYYRTVDEGTVRTCFLRGVITEETMYERMRELGYTDTRIKEIIQTWVVLPGPGDLFEMVAKEAFEPDIYTKLGLAEEFPTDQVEWLEKQGISQEWAMKYWIAHWAQPSIGQGFEMLHRGVIDMPTLDLLFRAVEIPSFWRDKLTKIAYQPYTRVDVRRMHDLGVIGAEALIQAYLDIGYDPDRALNMANFTILYNASHEKELTRGAILESYREGLITRADATQLLIEQEYSQDLADYYLTLEDYKRDKEVQDLQFDNIKEQYLLGLISKIQAKDSLNKLGLLGSKIDSLMEAWELQKYKYQRLPSKADCDRFLIKGIINEGEYGQILTQHGFAWRSIQMYLEDMAGDVASAGRAPSRADLDTWYKKKIIDEAGYRNEMKNLGYADHYIDNYLKEF
ncbi:hypothetical protein ES707_06694 [subsurface metagenome]